MFSYAISTKPHVDAKEIERERKAKPTINLSMLERAVFSCATVHSLDAIIRIVIIFIVRYFRHSRNAHPF